MRAHNPRRLGATMMMRPPGVRMRQISCSNSLGLSTVSSAWTRSTRSMQASGSGIDRGSTRAEAEGPVPGQFTTPWLAGMKASVRSLSASRRRQIGRRIAEAEHAQAREMGPRTARRPGSTKRRVDAAERAGVEASEVGDIDAHGPDDVVASTQRGGSGPVRTGFPVRRSHDKLKAPQQGSR